jgi:hypothetical protein
MKVSQITLAKRLADLKGARMVKLAVEVEPTMRKTGNPYVGRVVKQSFVMGVIGFRYENSVNNRRMVEANPETQKAADAVEVFIAEPRKWGVHIEGTPLVEHKGQRYLEVKIERTLGTEYRLDGQPVDPETLVAIKAFMPEREEGARQELEKPVVLRDYKLSSIRQVVMDGLTLDVTGN